MRKGKKKIKIQNVYEGLRTTLRKTDTEKNKTTKLNHARPSTKPFNFVSKFVTMSIYLVLLGHFLLTDYTRKSYRQVNPKFPFLLGHQLLLCLA